MELYELDLKQLIEVKLLRLNKPKFPNNPLPLNGSYNSIEDLTKICEIDINSQDLNFENRFKEYNLHDENSVGIDNMFLYYTSFGKVIFCETLEALLIINNISDKEIKIKDLKVKVSNEVLENYESMFKRSEYYLVNTNNAIIIPPNHFHNQKIKINADIMCKYSLEFDMQYSSFYFNEEYIKQSTNRIIKTIASGYSVELGTSNVIRKYYKKFLFATNLPFKIKDKFINDGLEKCYIEINLTNQTQYFFHINEMTLCPDQGNMNNNYITCLQEYKNFTIEPEEEINIIYVISNYRSFIINNSYVFKINWNNMFDSVNKFINFVLKNRLSNDTFTLLLVEKPNIIKFGDHFRIILQIINKSSKSSRFKINYEKQTDRELEIVDIIEREKEITDKVNITLICKSDVRGNVYLPRLAIYEESTKKTIHYDKLLNFNFF